MKKTAICPKCNGEKIYDVSPVQQTYCDAQGSMRNFNLTGAELPSGGKSMFGGEKTELEMAGPLGACVCAACGYTEWYMPQHAVDTLERMLAVKRVRLLTPQKPSAPFR